MCSPDNQRECAPRRSNAMYYAVVKLKCQPKEATMGYLFYIMLSAAWHHSSFSDCVLCIVLSLSSISEFVLCIAFIHSSFSDCVLCIVFSHSSFSECVMCIVFSQSSFHNMISLISSILRIYWITLWKTLLLLWAVVNLLLMWFPSLTDPVFVLRAVINLLMWFASLTEWHYCCVYSSLSHLCSELS